jgi:thiol-disulfide isomerase/thioredoxin
MNIAFDHTGWAMRPAIPLLVLATALVGCVDDQPAQKSSPPAARAGRPTPESAPPPRPMAAAETTEPDAGVGADAGLAAAPQPLGKPALLDFTRDHCLPCEIMAPWVKELRIAYGDRVEIAEINIDRPENKPLGRYFKARSIPTQVYLDAEGRELSRNVGLATKDQMERTLKRHGFLEAPAHEPGKYPRLFARPNR